jgi:hypothetical protein
VTKSGHFTIRFLNRQFYRIFSPSRAGTFRSRSKVCCQERQNARLEPRRRQTLPNSIPKDSVSGLRDRALMAGDALRDARCITCSSRYWRSTLLAAGLQSGQPLFQSVNSVGTAVTGRALNRYNAWTAIRKRAKAAVFLTRRMSHLAGYRYHHLPGERRTARARPADGRT